MSRHNLILQNKKQNRENRNVEDQLTGDCTNGLSCDPETVLAVLEDTIKL
jgi:hypothetical protein